MKLRRFFSELKRRNVIKATIAYLAVSWVIIQLASILFPVFEFPYYALKILIYILSFGLIVWVGFSWVYDWSAQGFLKTRELTENNEVDLPTSRSIFLYTIFASIILLGSWFIWKNISHERPVKVQSLAVLPFDNLSDDPNQDYFVSGLHDNLITALSKIDSIRIISKTSTLRYADTDKSMSEIANELSVDALIETSILKVGDSVRINIQLIQVFPEEKHLWAKIFDFHSDGSVLGLFNTFTQAAVREIHLRLIPERKALILDSIDVDPEAYKAYLKGKYFQEKLSEEGFDLALEFFQLSIALDSSFAPVYTELATTYLYMLQMRKIKLNEALVKIYKYNNMALVLDPNFADAIFTKAVMSWFEWDWKACQSSFQDVIDQNPNHVMANAFYGHLWMLNDRFDLAVPYMEKAVGLDPKNDMVLSLYGVVMAHKGEVEKAIQIGEESMKLNPRNILTLRLLEFGNYQKGEVVKSIQLLETIYSNALPVDIDLIGDYELHGYNAALGKLTKLMEENITDHDMYIAIYHNRMGNHEKAIEWIEKGFENHDVDIPYLFRAQSMKNLMSDPRIISISKKIQLPI